MCTNKGLPPLGNIRQLGHVWPGLVVRVAAEQRSANGHCGDGRRRIEARSAFLCYLHFQKEHCHSKVSLYRREAVCRRTLLLLLFRRYL